MTENDTNLQNNAVAENRADLGASELSVLLPCPFCGSEAYLDEVGDEWMPFCINMNCPAGQDGLHNDVKASAIKFWNIRAG